MFKERIGDVHLCAQDTVQKLFKNNSFPLSLNEGRKNSTSIHSIKRQQRINFILTISKDQQSKGYLVKKIIYQGCFVKLKTVQ